MTAEKHIPSSLYTQNTSHLPNSAFHNSESIGSVRGFRARFASQLVQFGASERVSRVNWFSSGLQSALHTHTHTPLSHTTVHSVSHTARSRRLEGKLHDQPPTAEKHTPSSLYTKTPHICQTKHGIQNIRNISKANICHNMNSCYIFVCVMKRVWVAAVRNDVTRKDCVCKQLKTVCIRAILNYIMNYAKALAWLLLWFW